MDALKAYRNALKLIKRTNWVLATNIDRNGWPDNGIRTNFACSAHYGRLGKKMNHKKLECYFPINSYSSRLQEVITCPKTALYYYDTGTGEACQVQGTTRVVKDDKTRRAFWLAGWNEQCPDGPEGDEYTLLRFQGKILKYYDGSSDSYWGPIVADERAGKKEKC